MLLRRTAVALAIALPGVLRAQHNPLAPIILQLPGGTRALAMGNTGVAMRDDDAIFYDPAMLVSATGMSASGEWLSSTAGTGSLSAVTRFNGGGIGIGMRFANYEVLAGGFPATRATMLDQGVDPATSIEATVGFAQTIKGFRAGIAGKYVEDVSSAARLGRPMADVGLSHDYFHTTFALAVQNIGRSMDLAPPVVDAPTRTTLGALRAGQAGPFDYVATAGVSLLRTNFVQPSGGVELNYSWLNGYDVALRAGARRSAVGEQPFTAGAGISVDRVTIDYALETLANQRVGHRFGIRVR